MGGAAWGWGAGRIPWAPGVDGDVNPGSRSAWLGKLGSARSGALAPRAQEPGGAVLPAPALDEGCIATGSVPCTRLPGWTQGGGGRWAPAARGAAKSRAPSARGAGVRGRSGAGALILAPTFRPGPTQMVRSQAGVPRSQRGEGCLQAAVPVSLSALQGLGSRAAGGVDREVLDWAGGDMPGRALGTQAQPGGPDRGFLACAWRDFVSVCLCPVCVCAEAPPASRVCTFCVRSERCLGKCPGWCGLRRPRG